MWCTWFNKIRPFYDFIILILCILTFGSWSWIVCLFFIPKYSFIFCLAPFSFLRSFLLCYVNLMIFSLEYKQKVTITLSSNHYLKRLRWHVCNIILHLRKMRKQGNLFGLFLFTPQYSTQHIIFIDVPFISSSLAMTNAWEPYIFLFYFLLWDKEDGQVYMMKYCDDYRRCWHMDISGKHLSLYFLLWFNILSSK